MTSMTSSGPEDLRDRMVENIKQAGHLRSSRIEQALRTVPRHRFVPEASAEDAYANKAITIKPGENRPASCASVPTVVAMMLDQLDPRPGENVLEIGAGTGYNAALLAELVGEHGQVTTIDIHPDVTDHARTALNETGYGRVRVLTGDGALGDLEHAPYDKIIVTVGPWDLPAAWFDQLAPGGRLVVPLHWRGQARSVAFVHEDAVLRAHDSQLCGFIPMIGIVPTGEQTRDITTDVALYWDADQPIDLDALRNVFTGTDTTVWSGATVVPNEPFDGIWLRLTATEPGTCRLAADDTALEAGVCTAAFPYRTPALVEGDSLAYLTKPRPSRTRASAGTNSAPPATAPPERPSPNGCASRSAPGTATAPPNPPSPPTPQTHPTTSRPRGWSSPSSKPGSCCPTDPAQPTWTVPATPSTWWCADRQRGAAQPVLGLVLAPLTPGEIGTGRSAHVCRPT